MERVKVIEEEYAFELEKELNSFVRKAGTTVLNISCYFDSSTGDHIAVIHYEE